MAWRTPTESDLERAISAAEIAAYRAAAAGADSVDPIAAQIASGVSVARGYMRGGGVLLGPEGTLPDSLIDPVMAYVGVDVVKRLPVGVTQDRRDARNECLRILRDIQARPSIVEQYGTAETASSAASVELAASRVSDTSPANLDGLL
jgi:hypothetical protein